MGQGGMSQRWYSPDYETGTTRPFKSLANSVLCVVFAAYRAATKYSNPSLSYTLPGKIDRKQFTSVTLKAY